MKRKTALLALLAMFTGCTQKEVDLNMKDPIDREANLSRDEFKNTMRPGWEEVKERNQQNYFQKLDISNTPLEYAPIIMEPSSPPSISDKLVSLSVTEDVPIKDVLLEISRLADLELALDSNITGGIILKVQDKPVNQVISIIAEAASLRYSIVNGVLHVQKDLPYLVNYQVDYINLNRSSKGSISIKTQVLSSDSGNSSSGGSSSSSSSSSGGSGGDDQGLNSGSSSSVTTEYDGDLWKSVENNVKAILNTNPMDLSNVQINVSFKDNALAAAAPNDLQKRPAESFYAVNRQAGMVSVMATGKKHAEVNKYLEQVRRSLSSQVLIEAKLVEVTLNEEYTAGIDWSGLRSKGILTAIDVSPGSLSEGSVFAGILSSDLLSITKKPTGNTTDPSQVLKFLQGFGTTRVLQNPRVSALNNQQAVLTFAKNKPYFTVQGTLQQPVVNANNVAVTQPVSITSQLHTIPIGVILTLQPSINLDKQEITLNIRPTISKEVPGAGVSDPAVQILSQSLSSQNNTATINSIIPVVEVREMDTVLTIKSGEVMVIGGHIENSDANTDIGVPLLSRVPIIGNLAKHVSKSTNLKETIILIQATIVTSDGYYSAHDKQIYQTFAQDPVPFALESAA